MFVVLLVVFVLIGIILETCTDSTVPWWDSFTTALSIIAMWMLAHKYVEQWLAWLVVDAVSCGIYIYKDLYFTSFLYWTLYGNRFFRLFEVETINEFIL